MTATDVTSAGFETGQLRYSLSNSETWPKFNFGKPGNFETGPCNLAGSGFETGVAVRALNMESVNPVSFVHAENPYLTAFRNEDCA